MSRTLRIYRLQVTYPPGSLEYGWEPPQWREQCAQHLAEYRDALDAYKANPTGLPWDIPVDLPEDYDRWPGWPVARMYFNRPHAERRADLFRKYGATVVVEASDPITWPTPEGA
jgi:hypothetical protein